jgi:hypothetical protein
LASFRSFRAGPTAGGLASFFRFSRAPGASVAAPRVNHVGSERGNESLYSLFEIVEHLLRHLQLSKDSGAF